MTQLAIDFTTASKINIERLTGQNRRLFDYLSKEGNTIHCFSEARKTLRIGYLNSRCSDLKNKHGVTIYKRGKKVVDYFGELVDVVEYSMYEFKD